MRVAAATYVVTVVVAGILAVMATFPDFPRKHWLDLVILLVAAALAESWEVHFSPESSMSLSFTIGYAAAVLFGAPFAAIVAGGAALFADKLVHRKATRYAVFNAGQLALCGVVTAVTFNALRTPGPLSLTSDALALVVAGAAYAVVNDTLVSGVLALSSGRSFTREWLNSFREVGVLYVSMAPLGALLAFTYQASRWTILYYPFLVLVIYTGFRLYVNLQTETENALVALADSVDKRDPYTYQHSLRVARLAGEIARRMRLPEKEVDLIVSAARIHDLGKISTDNRILYKQASLTEQERALINAHPAEGGELAGKFSMYRRGRAYIRHHHERWDGRGYPDGLAGEEIPLGARIIAVADAYDAMTSDRPYRQALSHEVAIAELRRGAGKQFDPAVVEAFCTEEQRVKAATLAREARESCSYS